MTSEEMKNVRESIEAQEKNYNRAVLLKHGIAQEKDRLANIIVNHLGDILEAMRLAENAKEEIATLNRELDDADAELKELDEEIKKLRAEAEIKASPGKKNKNEVKANGAQD